MHVAEVREIQQVVTDQQVVGVVVHVTGVVAPVGAVAGIVVWQQGQIGFLGLAHPDKHPFVLRHHGVLLDAGLCGRLVHAGHFNALPLRVEQQAVVTAAQVVAFHAPFGQGRAAMATTVSQGHKACSRPVHHNGLAQHGAGEYLPVGLLGWDFVIPCDDVPAISDEHVCISSSGVNEWGYIERVARMAFIGLASESAMKSCVASSTAGRFSCSRFSKTISVSCSSGFSTCSNARSRASAMPRI